MNKLRCHWPGADELMLKYHDEEWGVPVHDDNKLLNLLFWMGFRAWF